MSVKVVTKNRKAAHNYFLMDRYEAGIVLLGSEIKSIRAGQMSIAEAFVRVNESGAWLEDAHIAPYHQAGINNHEPGRSRKLLLHRREINNIWDEIRKKGVTVIPTLVYLKDGMAKVEIALAKGKRQYDKRAALAKRDAQREIERQLRSKR